MMPVPRARTPPSCTFAASRAVCLQAIILLQRGVLHVVLRCAKPQVEPRAAPPGGGVPRPTRCPPPLPNAILIPISSVTSTPQRKRKTRGGRRAARGKDTCGVWASNNRLCVKPAPGLRATRNKYFATRATNFPWRRAAK